MNTGAGITLVCCTYNRAAALRDTVPSKLAIEGVERILFVLDGSTDESEEYLNGVTAGDPRVEVVLRPHAGVQATRNFALSQVRTPWVLFIDDDDLTPPDFAVVLLHTAEEHDAAIVGAPWLNAIGRDVSSALDESKATPQGRLTFRSHPSAITCEDQETPFFAATILARTDIVRTLAYDAGYAGNSWREETDMFLRAFDDGHRLIRTSRTCSWKERDYSGGHRRRNDRLRAEFWIAVNEARFVRRHAATLSRLDPDWQGPIAEWARSVVPRLVVLIGGPIRRALRLLGGGA